MRNYDPQTGRFNCVDILAEHYFALTPYQFAGNNPVSYNDPTGAMLAQNEEPKENPAKFKNVRHLISYIEEYGIGNFDDDFNRWVFGAGGGTVEFASGNEFSINANGTVTFSWTAEILNGTSSTWTQASGSTEGSESQTLNTVVIGQTTMKIKDYRGYAMAWGEANPDASYSWYGGKQYYDVMWNHNYELFKSRKQRGLAAQSSGDRASYDRQLPGLMAQYQREQSALHTERMMYAGIGAGIAAPLAVSAALETGAVNGAYGSISAFLSEISFEGGILVNMAKNGIIGAVANEVSLYTTSPIVTSVANAGYQYTITGGIFVGGLYTIAGQFWDIPAFGKYYIPILPY